MGKAKKIFGGGSKKTDNSALKRAQAEAEAKAQQQAIEAARANQFNSKDNMGSDDAKTPQSGMGTTMLTDADGVRLVDNQQKKKTLLGG